MTADLIAFALEFAAVGLAAIGLGAAIAHYALRGGA